MPPETTPAFIASFRDQNLRIRETATAHLWDVTNSLTGALIARGESPTLEDAMIAAAGAAGADWGNAKWRSPGEADDEDAA